MSVGRCVGTYRVFDTKEKPTQVDALIIRKLPGQDIDDLPKDNLGRTLLHGELRLKNGEVIKFEKVLLGKVILNGDRYYKTVEIKTKKKGIRHFEFIGEYLDDQKQEAPGEPYIKLRGKLTEFIKGKQKSSTELSLYEEGYL